ncbi:hypothetical protein DOTSEDRAFT_67892 [Dothistroma septosporum NZE10]|uniref:WD repeat-containing protein JIP5 n=1 Tax=Dothistroma septosporum (strain NZE10 / CBS 128990) TaxID=675120 RepID=N1Q3F6_DOTSN|nr:hypothetical protein DOTSEDRAFT_67892 [Dothistroma septosporum NZE10]
MFDTICTLPLESDLFAQTLHPTDALLAVGLSSGHVAQLQLPRVEDDAAAEDVKSHGRGRGQGQGRRRRGSNGTDVVDTAWRTKRHKGSCRCLAYSVDGRQLYSAGTDGIVKAADSETGRVTGKIAIPVDPSSSRDGVDAPTVVHALSPQTLLLSTDSGALHLYDLRDPAPSVPVSDSKTAFVSSTPSQTYHPHADYISSLCPVPPSATSTSGYSKQWLTTGSTTLALTDLRRGVLAKSEDQEELLLSCLYVTGLAAKKSSGSTGEKAVVGGGDGVITLWEKGQWDDQDERITVSREKETLDCMTHIPDGIGDFGKKVAVGMGDGQIRFVHIGPNKIVGEVQHDEVEGVVGLSFDVGGRMISGGGQTIKVWQESIETEEEEEEAEGDNDDGGAAALKRSAKASDHSDEDDEDDDSSDDEKSRRHKKKRKRGKGQPVTDSNFNFAGLD